MNGMALLIYLLILQYLSLKANGNFYRDYFNGPLVNDVPDLRLPRGPFLGWKEEIVVNGVEESSFFNIEARSVKRWQRLKSDHLYLLGITDTGVILVTFREMNGNKYLVHEYPVDIPHTVKNSVMFKLARPIDMFEEGVVLLGLEGVQPKISVYKIHDFKLHHITDWIREGQLRALSYFKWYNEDRIIIFEDVKNNTFGNVYGFEIVSSVPHLWLTEVLPFAGLTGQPSIGVDRDMPWLAVIQEPSHRVILYSYRRVCEVLAGSKFELTLEVPNLVAKQVTFFHSNGNFYFLASGVESVLFRFASDGFLTKDVAFEKSKEMMVIPITSPKEDAIIMGKFPDGTPRFYTNGNDGLWREEAVSSCQSSYAGDNEVRSLTECLGGERSWEGATYVEVEGNPSIIFANRKYCGEIYHLLLSMKTIPAVFPQVQHDLLETLETYTNNLRRSITDFVTGKSSEMFTNDHPSSCGITEKINELQSMLSEVKHLQGTKECSPSALREFKLNRNEHNVVIDEAEPSETIQAPSGSAIPNNIELSTNQIEEPGIYSVTVDENSYKIPMISPDIENDLNKKYTQKVEGYEDIEENYKY